MTLENGQFDEVALLQVLVDYQHQKAQHLVAKARALAALLDDAEVNHGSLIGGVTLRAVGELRLELSKWPK